MVDTPPQGYRARLPTVDDAPAVAALIAACQLADRGEAETTAEELLSDWQELDLAEEAVVVDAPERGLAGYADVLNRSYVAVSVYGYVHPEHRGRGLGRYLVEWGERWARDRMDRAPEGARVVAQHYVDARNASARRLLEALGYTPARTVYRMVLDLDQPPPEPEWPEGTAARAFVPGRDEWTTFEAVEDAFRDVWGRPRNTFERFLRFARSEDFDPALSLLAEGGGELAGACLCKTVAGKGQVAVVAVRRPCRVRGLGLALLRQTFGEYYRRGVRHVWLSVDAESATGAPRLYARAGMRVAESYLLYQKELRPGEDLGRRAEAE